MKTLLRILAVLFGLIILGLILMAVLKVCPPAGPWPTPPWCAAGPAAAQPAIQTQPASLPETDQPAPPGEEEPIYLAGEPVILEASQYLDFDLASAQAVWTQLRYPDRYSGLDVISGSALGWSSPTPTSLAFTPQWPGAYRIQLDLTDGDGAQNAVIDLQVRPSQPYFELVGAALDYWNYTDAKAAAAPAIFDHLASQGVELVMLSPTWYMASRSSTEISPCPLEAFDPEACRGVISDQILVDLIEAAHQRGLAVLVKPHLKILSGTSPEWPGYMEIADWGAWFESYGNFVLHYAALAESSGVEQLSLGNELGNTCTAQTAYWRALISQVRVNFSGLLSYHDNTFSYEGSAAQFWDELDYIGVNLWAPASGVFDVPESKDPDVASMVQALEGQLALTLDPTAERFGKPVVITEFGTSNYDGANATFWAYDGPVDNGEQAAFYEAALRAFASRPYITGVIVWAYDWETSTAPERLSMSPLDKPAEGILQAWTQVR